MGKIFIRKAASGALVPADKAAEEAIKGWKVGSAFTLKYEKARNPKFHRLIFGVAQMVCDNALDGSYWQGKDSYHFIKAVELSNGFVDEIVDCGGEVHLIPRSIAFENMPDDEFNKLFNPLVAEAARVLGCSEQDILDNIGDRCA